MLFVPEVTEPLCGESFVPELKKTPLEVIELNETVPLSVTLSPRERAARSTGGSPRRRTKSRRDRNRTAVFVERHGNFIARRVASVRAPRDVATVGDEDRLFRLGIGFRGGDDCGGAENFREIWS